MSELTRIERMPLDDEAHEPRFIYPDGTMRVAAWQLYGSLFFGAVNKLEELLDPKASHPEVVILDMTRLVQLDTTGLEGLENLRDKLQKRGCTLLVCGLNSQPGSLLRRSGFLDTCRRQQRCADIEGTRTCLRAAAQPDGRRGGVLNMSLDLLIFATFIPVVIVLVAMAARRKDRDASDHDRNDDGPSPGSHLG